MQGRQILFQASHSQNGFIILAEQKGQIKYTPSYVYNMYLLPETIMAADGNAGHVKTLIGHNFIVAMQPAWKENGKLFISRLSRQCMCARAE